MLTPAMTFSPVDSTMLSFHAGEHCRGATMGTTRAWLGTYLQADDQVGQPILRVRLPLQAAPGCDQVIQYQGKPSGNPNANQGCDDAKPSLAQLIRHQSINS
jgi:hypothetical protein